MVYIYLFFFIVILRIIKTTIEMYKIIMNYRKVLLPVITLILFVMITSCEDETYSEMSKQYTKEYATGGQNNGGTGTTPPPDEMPD